MTTSCPVYPKGFAPPFFFPRPLFSLLPILHKLLLNFTLLNREGMNPSVETQNEIIGSAPAVA